jgi:hypothetical protein
VYSYNIGRMAMSESKGKKKEENMKKASYP